MDRLIVLLVQHSEHTRYAHTDLLHEFHDLRTSLDSVYPLVLSLSALRSRSGCTSRRAPAVVRRAEPCSTGVEGVSDAINDPIVVGKDATVN